MRDEDVMYSRARDAGSDAEAVAKVAVKSLTREQLEAEYVSLCGLAAYYGRLKVDSIGNPMRYFASIREEFDRADVEKILEVGTTLDAAPLLVNNMAPIINALATMKLMLDTFNPGAQDRGSQP